MAATLLLTLTDAQGRDLNDHVVVDLFSLTSSFRLQAQNRVVRNLIVEGIVATPATSYRIQVTPANYRPVQFILQFMDGQPTRYTAALPIDPSKVVAISGPTFQQLPPAAQHILDQAECLAFQQPDQSFLTGDALYSAWDSSPLFKACFLNIVAKSAATPLLGGGTCLQHYLGLQDVAQDRLFIKTTAALLEEASHSAAFHQVPFNLHRPRPDYHLVSSFKTFDKYGNLQLTFQRRGSLGDDYVVDVDIDDAQGIGHVFQVIKNEFTGPTNPYNIHEILVRQSPSVDPAYQFVLAAAATSRPG